MKKLTDKQIETLRRVGRGETVSMALRRSLTARGLVTSGRITPLGVLALPLQIKQRIADIEPGREYVTSDACPILEIDQTSRTVTVVHPMTTGYQSYASVTSEVAIELGLDGEGAMVVTDCTIRNWVDWRRSTSQIFVHFVFVGDSGHVYVHRPPATETWLRQSPEGADIRKRLRRLGGTTEGTIQQGDMLFVPAGRLLLPLEQYRHEVSTFGHHVPAVPVLQAYNGRHSLILILETTEIRHLPTTGAVHPPIVLPPGQWIVRHTARSLRGGGQD